MTEIQLTNDKIYDLLTVPPGLGIRFASDVEFFLKPNFFNIDDIWFKLYFVYFNKYGKAHELILQVNPDYLRDNIKEFIESIQRAIDYTYKNMSTSKYDIKPKESSEIQYFPKVKND